MNVIQIQVKVRKRAEMDLDNFENQGNKGRQYTMTIKEIAQMAGVSSAAVSRYLNGGYVSEQKKEQIRKVIEKTGYQPSTQARILRTGRAHLVGVVAPKINSESISRITAGIEQVLSARGYQMLLASTDNQPKNELIYLRIFESYPVDGIVLIGTVLTDEHRRFLKESKVPVVVVGQETEMASCIYHDDFGAGRAMGQEVALKALKRNGGRPEDCKIAYIGVTREDKAAGAAREDGFRKGLQEAGITFDDHRYRRESEFTMSGGYEAVVDLLSEENGIDIISCATDTIAAGAIEALIAQSKKEVPESVQNSGARMLHILEQSGICVTGFGDNQLLRAVTGGIPTVHFGYKTSGIKGAELLLEQIEEKNPVPVHMKLGFQIVNRFE